MTAPYSDSPGVKSRKQQLADRLRDLAEARAERDISGPQGTVDARTQVANAQRALKRQQNVAAGKPALDDQ